jgi:hypothetical protein
VWEGFNHMRGRIVGHWLLDAASGAPRYERLTEYLCESNRCNPTDPIAGDHIAWLVTIHIQSVQSEGCQCELHRNKWQLPVSIRRGSSPFGETVQELSRNVLFAFSLDFYGGFKKHYKTQANVPEPFLKPSSLPQ